MIKVLGKKKKQIDKSKDNDFLENSPNAKRLVGEDTGQMTLGMLLKDPKTKQFLGLGLMLFAVYAFFSFFSYWWNYAAHLSDHAVVSGDGWKLFSLKNQVTPYNMMGMFGAKIAHLFVFRLFGFTAFVLPLLLFNWGLQLFTGKGFAKHTFLIKLSLFALLWVGITLGFFTLNSQLFAGGGMGYFTALWLVGLLGWYGTLLLMVFSGVAFLAFYLNLNIFPNLKRSTQASNTVEQQPIVEPSDIIASEVGSSILTDEKIINDTDTELQLVTVNQEEETETDTQFVIETPAFEEETEEVEMKQDLELITLDLTKNSEPPPIIDSNESDIPFEIAPEKPTDDEGDIDAYTAAVKHVGLNEPYDPWLDLPGYKFPTDDLLKDYDVSKSEINREELESSKNMIVETLKNYNIGIKEIKATIGPTVTLYEIIPVSGVRISKIKNLEDDIALSLAALGIRIIAPIPGKGTIGIEVPNKKPEMVPMSSVIKSKKFRESNFELPVILGKTISNELYIADLAKMPHLLVAGATGQGKSVGLNCLIISLLYKKHPTELKFVLVDPKKVELSLYNKLLKHFLAKLPGDGDAIITDTNVVKDTLNSLCVEMDNRYNMLKEGGCRNIIEYNNKFKQRRLNPEKGHAYLPYIVAIIDEVADLMMTAGREVETPIARLAQLARAVGIHVILATQRPSVNIITGTIKANFPARLAFRVTSKIDSRTILDNNGADQLIGKGDMLFYSGSELVRLQCPFVDTPEADAVVDFIEAQRGFGGPFILPDAPGEESEGNGSFDSRDKDELFEEAARIIVETQQGSTSMIQRKLKIGFNRAGRLVDQLEAAGIVGPSKGSKARDVLYHDLHSLEQYLEEINR